MPQRLRTATVMLHPGDYFVGDAQHRIATLLGSCVSITLWSARQQVGAMSHYLLAQRPEAGEPNARYGEDALALMLDALQRRGVQARECEAKVFGGGHMFSRPAPCGALDVGRRNGEAARRLLQAHGLRLVSASLFGDGHRQLLFDVATGAVWCRQVALRDIA